ncbi:hypothetical protein J5N97_010331 [Dioscorea zingiberensis]|uniref:Uncharacterized protein n=1 Tax=Dioscorea zingiberensis TaxID=325984 RepID=A0A9D5CYY1_9LILI|nr:hypothetical protein J5N97_010331 [Dioscorea zingiberensis]
MLGRIDWDCLWLANIGVARWRLTAGWHKRRRVGREEEDSGRRRWRVEKLSQAARLWPGHAGVLEQAAACWPWRRGLRPAALGRICGGKIWAAGFSTAMLKKRNSSALASAETTEGLFDGNMNKLSMQENGPILYEAVLLSVLEKFFTIILSLPSVNQSKATLKTKVEGQKITWLTPHALQQVLTDDVDFNVMLTFLEFYEAKSVLFQPASEFLPHINEKLKKDTCGEFEKSLAVVIKCMHDPAKFCMYKLNGNLM